ncbi:MAG: zinc-binding dehydrogenase, partial [Acidobacteriota bacterium]|nr:zinc-binding dehydrogenase [Acidobacteriota bacterium]
SLGLETIGADEDVLGVVNAWTGGEGADVSFEVTGHPAAVRLVTDVVRVWGTINVIAIHAEPVPVNLYPIFARELTLLGSRLYTRAAWEEAIELASSGAIAVGSLVTRSIPLEQLQNGMEELLAGGPAMKVLVNLD